MTVEILGGSSQVWMIVLLVPAFYSTVVLLKESPHQGEGSWRAVLAPLAASQSWTQPTMDVNVSKKKALAGWFLWAVSSSAWAGPIKCFLCWVAWVMVFCHLRRKVTKTTSEFLRDFVIVERWNIGGQKTKIIWGLSLAFFQQLLTVCLCICLDIF